MRIGHIGQALFFDQMPLAPLLPVAKASVRALDLQFTTSSMSFRIVTAQIQWLHTTNRSFRRCASFAKSFIAKRKLRQRPKQFANNWQIASEGESGKAASRQRRGSAWRSMRTGKFPRICQNCRSAKYLIVLVGAVRFELTTTGTPFRVVDCGLFYQSIRYCPCVRCQFAQRCPTVLNGLTQN